MTLIENHNRVIHTASKTRQPIWVKTHLEGANTYSLSIIDKQVPKQAGVIPGCAFAQLSLMESGSVLAYFPLSGMVSGTIRSMMGEAWFELAVPFKLPEFIFGYDIEIAAGKHPMVFVLESWLVSFRPLHLEQL